ncbi:MULTISPECIES: UDP-galactopyranose mutase [Leptospirillum]|jgi:UDP-galactopyranose mutase|uniref:UDP-galactopyranose mutase n=1 Tax=Leptospirillum ferriphilum YSK TaxID=1441628 RepID=A0A059XTL6_9BACT|nr:MULTISPECIES: UDP-galactopyranose mutase [Leptospirillum]EAY57432.1 MAG: UDP-galactopyranose mutase [Leptospirillum rubarum]EIJ75996.1 MAG: UDP-galactopyranose mutase [Leptospirillum sp. Group II 'C75']AIA30163.1 UDP-galactopyranose mutase [Leptospirillum ferriphilum YSK]AKS23056.1 UDP-galactopyranose mutase [Leptospirillum sp. Group II 'CF-1']OOH83712.1 UDP-galactopyranose mutase [Leptospirillum ferriphilum]
MELDVLVVGAGFAGSVVAERLASAGRRVLVIDRRSHIAGNAFDENDAQGVLIHRYGPHIFHTNSDEVFAYLSRFTDWRPYEHRVLASVDGKLLPIPINLDTVNRLYGLHLDEEGLKAYFETVREPRETIRTSEDVIVNTVGWDLYRKFYQGYTRKQWGLDPSELFASVASRVPVRTNRDDRYFTDTHQAMPKEGYTPMFARILDHPNISIELGRDFREIRTSIRARHIVYTGPIDEYFDHCFGKLPYRSLRFEHEQLPGIEQYQPVGTVNYPNEHAYTRITEFRHLTGQTGPHTSIVREYPQAQGDPYYPIPRPENDGLFKKYQALAQQEKDVTFVGRLAQYRYYNMDQVVGAALSIAKKILGQPEA